MLSLYPVHAADLWLHNRGSELLSGSAAQYPEVKFFRLSLFEETVSEGLHIINGKEISKSYVDRYTTASLDPVVRRAFALQGAIDNRTENELDL
jgi:hypothetical protein